MTTPAPRSLARRLAPLVAVAALAFVGYCAYANTEASPQNAPTLPEKPPVPIVTEAAAVRTFRREVNASGTLLSKNFSVVSPRASGVIDDVFVREGDPVEAGKTQLFRMDSLKLESAMIVARQAVSMNKNILEERKAALAKAEADAAKVEKDFIRSKRLREQQAIPEQTHDAAESADLQAKAGVRLAQAQVETAQEDVKRAEAALAITEKELRDATVLAPVSGVVSQRYAEPGENGQAGTPIVRIDDPVNLEAMAFVPGQFYEEVRPKATRILIRVNDRPAGESVVNYRSPTIDGTLHTFKIKSDIQGDGERLVPGAMANLSVVLQESQGIGVPTAALVERGGKWAAFVADGEKARLVPMERTGLETDGWTEVKGNLKAGDRVVVRGQFLLEDGSPVREQKNGE